MSVLKVYRSLDAEQKRILAEKQVDLNRPIAELLTLLKPIAACDRVADKARTRLGCTFGAGIVLTIILTFFVAGNFGGLAAIAVLLIGLTIIIGSGWLWFWTKKIDLSNNMRDFVLPVLSVIREDVDSNEPVHVKLDLRSPTSDAKRTSKSDPYKSGAYYKVIDSMYVDPWMEFEGALTDGTKLSWRITDTIRERQKTKRNPRGKIKTKTKYAKKSDIEVAVGLRNKTYAIGSDAGDVKSGDKRNTVQMYHRHRSASLDPIPTEALIGLITAVYSKTRPAGKEA